MKTLLLLIAFSLLAMACGGAPSPEDLPPCKYADITKEDNYWKVTGYVPSQAGAPDEIEGSPFCKCPAGGCAKALP